MPDSAPAGITAILFTDLVDSTALMQRVGDEEAQRLFQAHHRVLQHAIAATGGEELQWVGFSRVPAVPRTPAAGVGERVLRHARGDREAALRPRRRRADPV